MAREMKESNIEWVGEIPANWDVLANKYIMKKQKRICEKWQGENVLSLTLNGVIVRDLVNPTGKMPATFDGYQFVYENELLMCLFDIDVTPRCIGRIKTDGVTSPAYSCFKLFDGYDSGYYYYYYLMVDYTKELLHLAKNLRHSFTEDQLGVLKVPVPPEKEQIRIAEYLDKKMDEINSLIDQTKSSIEEYKKLRQSLISNAVFGGITDKVYDECGLGWIDGIPRGWEVKKIKKYFEFGKGLPITKDNLTESGIDVISYGQVHSKLNNGVSVKKELVRHVSEDYRKTNASSLVKKGDFIFADTSEDLAGCGNAVLVDMDSELFAGYHTIILRTPNEKDSKYLAYLFLTDMWRSQIRSRVSGIKLFSVTQKILRDLYIILPPPKKQKIITDYLDSKCNEIDTIISDKLQFIVELDILKKSLVYEVVTGKREV